ncbi:hypothetical protein KEM55_003694 [Ascosphaera atra]|nr:hypothetical protein KEM55_003694 [Ascosphaera atra]
MSAFQFAEVTGCDESIAQQYLSLADGNFDNAITLFFENGGAPLGDPQQQEREREIINIDSDDEPEDDEAMARRLQREMEAQARPRGRGALDEEGVRAPMARTTETLVGGDDDDDLLSTHSVMSRLAGAGRGRGGIFDQHGIWSDDNNPAHSAAPTTPFAASSAASPSSPAPLNRRQRREQARSGTPDSNKVNRLAELYKPPLDLITALPFEVVRERARSSDPPRWVMVNIQDPSIFDCQVLNRDLWKDPSVKAIIQENFLFAQYTPDDPRAATYMNYYFPPGERSGENGDAFPYIAILDPRTGELVKLWKGRPVPKPTEFLMQVVEFLDRFSLVGWGKNPPPEVPKEKKKEKKKDIDAMTEDELIEMAMKESLGQDGQDKEEEEEEAEDNMDVKGETQEVEDEAEGKGKETEPPSLFHSIPTPSTPPPEPAASAPNTTRIQFRHPHGRVIRRFNLSDPVQSIYEWLKADPGAISEEMRGQEEFDLVCLGKNLLEAVEKGQTIEEAGLKNGTVMVAWERDDD